MAFHSDIGVLKKKEKNVAQFCDKCKKLLKTIHILLNCIVHYPFHTANVPCVTITGHSGLGRSEARDGR